MRRRIPPETQETIMLVLISVLAAILVILTAIRESNPFMGIFALVFIAPLFHLPRTYFLRKRAERARRKELKDELNEFLEQAIVFARERNGKVTVSMFQREYGVSYARASRLLQALYELGEAVAPPPKRDYRKWPL